MRMQNNLKTKIFLDGGIPDETKEAIRLLGFLDGQTTNPTLITKHPSFLACQAKGEKCTEEDGWKYYKEIVSEISPLVAQGIRINMTLCFSQEQAAAVYTATKGAKKGDVFVSPFSGRIWRYQYQMMIINIKSIT